MSDRKSIYDSQKRESPFYFNDHPRDFKNIPLTKAYRNQDFLNSSDARVIRIMSEYLEVASRLERFDIKDTVVFYGSARLLPRTDAKSRKDALEAKAKQGNADEELRKQLVDAERALHMSRYYEDARSLAYQLSNWAKDLEEDKRFIVCSGGGPGIMEAANRGAAEAGCPTIGMNISLPFEQEPNSFISENLAFEFHYFFMRKFWFVYLAKALVVFPGGFGTFDELFELLTLRQTQKVKKPLCVVIYGKEFWDKAVDFEHLVDWGVISAEDLDLFHIVDEVEEAFITLRNHFEREFVGKPKYWHM